MESVFADIRQSLRMLKKSPVSPPWPLLRWLSAPVRIRASSALSTKSFSNRSPPIPSRIDSSKIGRKYPGGLETYKLPGTVLIVERQLPTLQQIPQRSNNFLCY
jgi:hypothetical protein